MQRVDDVVIVDLADQLVDREPDEDENGEAAAAPMAGFQAEMKPSTRSIRLRGAPSSASG